MNLVIERPKGGIITNQFSRFSEHMVSEIKLRIAKQQLDTPEPVLITKPVSALRSVNAPFACITLDLEALPTLSISEKHAMEDYLRRGGFLWIIAHYASASFDAKTSFKGEPFFEHILGRVLPSSVITPENVKPAGFRPVIPPSVIDPSMSTELTELVADGLKKMDILSLEGRPVAIVSQTFLTTEVKDIYRRSRPSAPPSNSRQQTSSNTSRPKEPDEDKSFDIKHVAINIYTNIMLH